MDNFLNNLRGALSRFGTNFRIGLSRFMAGRYGTDRLNTVILCVGLAASVISAFVQGTIAGVILVILSYFLMGFVIFRCLSRNTARRYQENRRFLLMIDRIKDRENRYFICPKCRQTVRVPRHKGKIAITCPKCRERFERKT